MIPAFNEETQIGGCLTSLAEQRTQVPFEVIVVDNASTDRTAEIAREYAGQLRLQVIREPRKGRGAARRTGFAAAGGDIICSTDADAWLPPDWITAMAARFTDSAVGAVSGTCYVTDSTPWVNAAFSRLQPLFMHLYRLMMGQYWLTGSNFAIRKDIYERSGGFLPEWNEQEDVELGYRVNRLSRIRFVGTPGVRVSGRRFRKGLAAGLAQYLRSFVDAFWLKRQAGRLGDER